MKHPFNPNRNLALKVALLFFLLPFISTSQVAQNNLPDTAAQHQRIRYLQRSDACLRAGLLFQGAGIAAILFAGENSTLVLAGGVAFTIGTVAVIESYFLRRKARQIPVSHRDRNSEPGS